MFISPLQSLDSAARVDQKITVIMGEMQKLEAQRSFVRERLEQARQDLRAASQVDQTNRLGLEKKVSVERLAFRFPTSRTLSWIVSPAFLSLCGSEEGLFRSVDKT